MDLDHNTVNRALELNGELAKLKEENEKLKKENRFRKDKEELLLEEVRDREEIVAATEAVVKRWKEEAHRQKVSLDSLFSDLEESQRLVRKLRKDVFEKKFGSEAKLNRPEPKEEGQAQFLTPTGSSGKPVQSNGFFSGLGGANSAQQWKIYNLEKDNVKLKSEVVRLQAQYREELYLNRRADKELPEDSETASTESPDASLSLNEDSDDSSSNNYPEEEHNRRSGHAKSNSLRRIKEYKGRKASLPTAIISPVRQPQRTGSLQSSREPSFAERAQVNNKPSKGSLFGRPQSTRRIGWW